MSNSLLNMSHMLVITFDICTMLSNLLNKATFSKKERYKTLHQFHPRTIIKRYELGLLFYNCLSDRGTKFKEFVEDYAFLRMYLPLVIDEEHRETTIKKVLLANLFDLKTLLLRSNQ